MQPAYPLFLGGQQAWGGDHSAAGWQPYSADLSAYKGHSVMIRFGFQSDSATVFPGVYIDDVTVAEPLENPLYITTTSLPDGYVGTNSPVQITKVGGTNNSHWSIVGGTNDGWLSIGASTGILSGAPQQANIGPVSVTIRVDESPTMPSNFAEATFTFNVKSDIYYTSFEDTCPAGWTLTGDWQCGVPINVGPTTAYVGTQCLATQIAGNYNNSQTWATTTATSPDIDLTTSTLPVLTFHLWMDTEGSTYDGFDLQVSTDGGMNYSVVSAVTPALFLTIDGEQAWGGHDALLGWQLYQADLSAYAGNVVRLRFAFDSDDAGVYPGVYIDDVLVN